MLTTHVSKCSLSKLKLIFKLFATFNGFGDISGTRSKAGENR